MNGGHNVDRHEPSVIEGSNEQVERNDSTGTAIGVKSSIPVESTEPILRRSTKLIKKPDRLVY